nr:hypothetical protein [Solirubrobacterales bacterium]
MTDRPLRALVAMLVAQLALVAALIVWAATGFSLPEAITGEPAAPAVSTPAG